MIANPSLNDAFATVDGAYGRRRWPGWAVSLVLHGLLAFFLVRQLTALPADAPVVPVEVVQIAPETVMPAPAPAKTEAAPAARTAVAPPRPLAALIQAAPAVPALPNPSSDTAQEPVVQDELETKLAALAKLRQPESSALGGTGTAGTGRRGAGNGSVSVKDLIRAQVERRWSLDTETLNGRNVTVSIRVVLDHDGIVTRADILDAARYETDALYHEIALRARNAVLLSSPFHLPLGHDEVTDVTLVLNPRDTFR